MQFSGMLRNPLEVADLVPHPGVRIELKTPGGNRVHKIARRGKKLLHQIVVFGEKQRIAQKAPHPFRRRQLVNLIRRALLQKKERSDRSTAVFSRSREFSRKRSAVRRVPASARPQ